MQIIASPHQKLYLSENNANHELRENFQKGSGYGLLALDALEDQSDEIILYWKSFIAIYLHNFALIRNLDNCDISQIKVKLSPDDLQNILLKNH